MSKAVKAIKAGWMIDGTGQEPVAEVLVLIEGATIKSVVKQDELSDLPPDTDLIDAQDAVLMPGLIDMHVHLGDPLVSNVYAYNVETPSTLAVFYAARSAQQALAAGFTTLRNMGSLACVSVREAFNAGLLPGPRVLTSGRVLMTGGHTDKIFPAALPRHPMDTADGADEVRKRVREFVFAGVDFIKLEATGGSLESIRSYTDQEIQAIVDEAHALGVKVAGHAHSTEGILRSIEAGVDTLEHGTFIDEECADKLASKGIFFVPTLARLFDGIARASEIGLSATLVDKFKDLRDTRLASLQRAHGAGVKIALGTNASNKFAPHGTNALEFEALTHAGLSPMESLMAGTSVAAEALGLSSFIGTIEAGKKADLILVGSNPLDDLASLQDQDNILQVWKDGEVLIDRIENREKVEIKWSLA